MARHETKFHLSWESRDFFRGFAHKCYLGATDLSGVPYSLFLVIRPTWCGCSPHYLVHRISSPCCPIFLDSQLVRTIAVPVFFLGPSCYFRAHHRGCQP